jgi:peptide chain release factor subunit 1
MTPPAVGADTLQRLGTLGEDGDRVLSVYLDLDPSRFPTPAARGTEVDSLLAQARRAGAGAEADRVQQLLQDSPELLRDGRGLAVFSCAPKEALEAFTLPEPVEPLAVFNGVPWLEPLVAVASSESWGVAVLSRRGARLFRGGRRGLVELAAVTDDVHGRHAQGGWSQARYQRGIEQEVAEHVRNAVARLQRMHRRRPFEQLVVVAASELRPLVESQLPAELRERLAGSVERDLEHATTGEIMEAILPVLERIEQEREQAALARLAEALATGGPAAAGLDEVRSLLEQDRVALLLVEDAPRADELEHLVDAAAATGVETLVVRHAPAALHAHGPVAALLRW